MGHKLCVVGLRSCEHGYVRVCVCKPIVILGMDIVSSFIFINIYLLAFTFGFR